MFNEREFWKELKNILMIQRNVFPFEISLDSYFYLGTALQCQGSERQTLSEAT